MHLPFSLVIQIRISFQIKSVVILVLFAMSLAQMLHFARL